MYVNNIIKKKKEKKEEEEEEGSKTSSVSNIFHSIKENSLNLKLQINI
jgi:hypothetical protein